MQQLTDQALVAVLCKLQGEDVGKALLVCRDWCDLLQGEPGLRAEAEKQAATSRRERRSRPGVLYSLADWLDHDRCIDDYYDDVYSYRRGYGSPYEGLMDCRVGVPYTGENRHGFAASCAIVEIYHCAYMSAAVQPHALKSKQQHKPLHLLYNLHAVLVCGWAQVWQETAVVLCCLQRSIQDMCQAMSSAMLAHCHVEL
jgi:hypothetical protein